MLTSLKLKFGAGLVAMSVLMGGAGIANAAPADERAQVVSLTNQTRGQGGAIPLIESAELNTVAQAWADEMAATGYRHSDATWRSDRMTPGWDTHGENIAKGYPNANEVVAAWVASSGHYQNIMNTRYTRIGVGYVAGQNLWVQVFAGYPADRTATPAPVPDPAADAVKLYKVGYDSTIFEIVPGADGSESAVALTYAKWRDVYRLRAPEPASTDFVKYPWSPTVYAVTFWPGGESKWMWTPLTFPQWQTAGQPSPRAAGWIKGSYYYQWGTSAEIFVEGADGVNHKLSYPEWAASGFRAQERRGDEGYLKLSWAPEFARMSSLSTGAGRPMGYDEWQAEAFPTPSSVQRMPGDTFYSYRGSSTVWYAGPGMNRPVSLSEWQAAGSPAPIVRG